MAVGESMKLVYNDWRVIAFSAKIWYHTPEAENIKSSLKGANMAGPRSGSSGGRSAAIASGRGGSFSLGVKGLAIIGRGVEGGSSAPIQARLFATERGSKFKAFLNSAKGSDVRNETPTPIYQPFTITEIASLKASASRPVESPVTTEAPTKITPFPRLRVAPAKDIFSTKNTSKGEIRFFPAVKPAENSQVTKSEPLKLQAERGAGVKIVTTPERTGLTPFEQIAVLSKIQANLKFIRSLRSQPHPRVGLNAEAETVTYQTSQPAVETSTTAQSQSMPENNSRPNQGIGVPPRIEGSGSFKKSRGRFVLEPVKFIVDETANNARVEALLLAQKRLEAKNQDQSFSNEAVVQESGISYEEKFGSNALRKAGIRRLDGTQPRTGRDVAAVLGRLNREKLKRIIYDHTAIDYGEGRAVGKKAIYEVSTLPEEQAPSVDLEKTLPVKASVVTIESAKRVTTLRAGQAVEESKQINEVVKDLAFEATGRNLDVVGSVLDRVLYINNVISFNPPGRIEAEERNKLLAS